MLTVLSPAASKAKTQGAACHNSPQANLTGLPLVAIVGSPNVGKSVLFNALTGAYAVVSNYPGTTVEVTRGKGRLSGKSVGVVDTPGMYRLVPLTEEERVARDILLTEQPAAVIHVVDTKNLERMLPMTLQLIEAGLPVFLVCNLADEADRIGIRLDTAALERSLRIPVISTALAVGRGKDLLLSRLSEFLQSSSTVIAQPASLLQIPYHPAIETNLAEISALLTGSYHLAPRAIALLLLQGDLGVLSLVQRLDGDHFHTIRSILRSVQSQFSQPLAFLIARQQRDYAGSLLPGILTLPAAPPRRIASWLEQATLNPLTGLPILAFVLFLLYQFVGVLGAQTLVAFFEETLFGQWINPWVDHLLASIVPWEVLRSLIGGEYGLITLGVRYAFAIILPLVGTFFLAFSVIEDSGYLPRLAMLIDRVFKFLGLNGRAVIPMVLGFGCDTMATVVTRTLETRRERLLATFLLALAIPCSAQLGVMLGMLGGKPILLALWLLVVSGVFLLVGLLAARLLPGERPSFYMELPPLRLPHLGNVLVKTYTRMEWYFREVMPMFLLASLLIWFGKLTGLFDLILLGLSPLVRWLGLPDQVGAAFLFGFFRRDYGAAGLYDLRGLLSGSQMLVAIVTLTLFVPCIAQFAVTVKERGWKTALAISAFIFPFAFLVGGFLNWIMVWFRVDL